MKKLIGIVLAVVVCLSMSCASFAHKVPLKDLSGSIYTPTLKYGSKDTEHGLKMVRYLQDVLRVSGYKVTTDGKFGSETETAVKKFQKDHDIDDDGIVGKETWKRIHGHGYVYDVDLPNLCR